MYSGIMNMQAIPSPTIARRSDAQHGLNLIQAMLITKAASVPPNKMPTSSAPAAAVKPKSFPTIGITVKLAMTGMKSENHPHMERQIPVGRRQQAAILTLRSNRRSCDFPLLCSSVAANTTSSKRLFKQEPAHIHQQQKHTRRHALHEKLLGSSGTSSSLLSTPKATSCILGFHLRKVQYLPSGL